MKINRANFLHILESVSAGLTVKETIQGSSSFIFSDGFVFTNNDEIVCRMPSGLDESWRFAVRADELLKILRALPEEELDLSLDESILLIRGKGKRGKHRLEADVILPNIDQPEKWQTLPSEFAEAIGLVQHCCGGKNAEEVSSYIHLSSHVIEATDRFQLARFTLEMELEPCLISKQAARHIATLGFTQMAQSDSWVHFRNAAGLELACRRSLDEFPQLDEVLKTSGEPITLPKSLVDAASRGHIYSEKNVEGDKILVELRNDRLRITGQGVNGEYSETKKLTYSGKPIAFLIAPELLSDIVSRHNDCEITQNCLKVTSGKYVYMTWLKQPEGREQIPEASVGGERG